MDYKISPESKKRLKMLKKDAYYNYHAYNNYYIYNMYRMYNNYCIYYMYDIDNIYDMCYTCYIYKERAL